MSVAHNFTKMTDSLDIENELLSYSNPNYQLEPPDVNSNLDSVEDYEDLYKEFDTVCRYNRKSGIESRRKYAQLDPVSMGVELNSETLPMLTADSDNNLKGNSHVTAFQSKGYELVDNDISEVDSNDNKEVSRRSGFLDYYINLETSLWQNKDCQSVYQSVHSSSDLQPNSSPAVGNEKEMTVGSGKAANAQNNAPVIQGIDVDDSSNVSDKKRHYSKDQQMPSVCSIPKKQSPKCVSPNDIKENDTLPSGWEKHEDDSGPYYWHISSGTIQREPPSLCSSKCEISPRNVKQIDVISSFSDFSLNSQNVCSPAPTVMSEPHCSRSVCLSENKLKRRSYPEGSCSLTLDKRPIRFAVRSLGWVEIAEDDLTPEKSSKAVNKCIVDLSMGRNDILDVVGRWGDGKDLFMDLDDYSLRLMDTQDLTILNTQPIHTIRVWGVGRDNGKERDFAYVARDRITRKYMCHVFRCDIPARIIANTLRDICKKIMIERSSQQNMAKQVGPRQEPSTEILGLSMDPPSRPTNLPTEQRRFMNSSCQSSYTGQSFPTPMEEPKKVLKVHYLGTINVNKATGVEVLNDAIAQLSMAVPPAEYKFVNVAVAPSTITISEPGDSGKLLEECRVRFLSFLGIGRNIKHCGFIVHTAQDKFVAHVFYCEPSSGALCKTIEAACKLRYQKCLDAHRKVQQNKCSEAQGNKGLATTLRSILGSISRLTKSVET